MIQQYKVDLVKDISNDLKGRGVFFINYDSISACDIAAIRTQIREIGGKVKVCKNTFLKFSILNIYKDFRDVNVLFKGMIAIVIINDDLFLNCAKVLEDSEKQEKIEIKGGIYQKEQINADYVRRLASIPSKEELYGILVGCLNGIFANLVFVLDDIKKSKEK